MVAKIRSVKFSFLLSIHVFHSNVENVAQKRNCYFCSACCNSCYCYYGCCCFCVVVVVVVFVVVGGGSGGGGVTAGGVSLTACVGHATRR